MEEKEEEGKRREEAIESTPSLQPNFKPSSRITQSQLAKFQELHRRRLQLKSKSDKTKKSKVSKSRKPPAKDLISRGCPGENSSKTIGDSSVSESKGISITTDASPPRSDNVAVETASKKRQKLHWGLDTKERWERKSNM
ncbi:hypothetical protein LguiA_014124 [Lonicera macranthoides]